MKANYIKNPEWKRLAERREAMKKQVAVVKRISENRALSEVEKADLDVTEDNLAYVDRQVSALEEALDAEASDRARRSDTATATASDIDGAELQLGIPGHYTGHVQPSRPTITGEPAAKFAARIMGDSGLDRNGFATLGDFMTVVKSERFDERLGALAAGQKEGSGSAGGFLVPTEFAYESWSWMYRQGQFWQMADTHPMTSETKTISGWDSQTAASGTLFGGWTPEWIEEGGTMSVQTAEVRQIALKARKLALLAKSSNEIERDSEALPTMMTEGMGMSLAYTIEKAMMRGTGAGQPLGGLTSASRITCDKESGQAAASITYRNLADMFARMHPELRATAVWMANSDCIPELLTLTIDVGTAGSHMPVMSESNGTFTILTRPVIFTDHCSALGTEGDVCFANWQAYALGMRKDIAVEKSAHIYFESDETAYRAIARVDGMPKMSSVFTPERGDTKSWFCTVQTRS